MADEHSASVLGRNDQAALIEELDSSQAPDVSADTEAKIAIVPPHILSTTSTTTGHSGMVSIVSSRTVSLESGAAASSSATSVPSGSTPGGVLAIVFIIIIILSVISCVAGCIWRCCIQKGRKERVAQANQQKPQEYPQSFPQERSQNYHHRSDMPDEQIYGRTQNEISMHDIDMNSASRSGKLNTGRRFETIPEHEDISEDNIFEQEPIHSPDLQNSNVSPRKGYFYHRDAAGE